MERLAARHGQAAVLVRDGAEPRWVRAFIQPVLSRGQEEPQETPTPLGTARGRRWRYLGPAAVAAGDRVEALGRRFRVRAAEPVEPGKGCAHWWAMLEEEDREDDCL